MPSIMKIFESKRDHLHKALKELEKVIYPRYQEAAFYIPAKRTFSELNHGFEHTKRSHNVNNRDHNPKNAI